MIIWTPFSLTRRRALVRISKMLMPGVSSIYIGAFSSLRIFLSSLFHSSSSSCPFSIFFPDTSLTLDIRRLTSCTLLISSEKKATGIPASTAMFFAKDRAKAVFPIAGRPAMMTKSDFCQPEVLSSRSV